MTEKAAGSGETDQGLRLVVQEGFASLVFDRPDSKVNLLTTATMRRLDGLLGEVEVAHERGEVGALVIRSGKPGTFIAGADINELAQLADAEQAARVSSQGQQILLRLARLPLPTLAAIDGACMGGGLELALSCNYRVASDSPKTRLALPETRLGIIPGLGGTVRLPRLIGLSEALGLILSGKQLSASRALNLGLIDRMVAAENFADAVDGIGRDLAQGLRPLRAHRRSLWSRLVKDSAPVRAIVRRFALKGVLARTKGHYPALPRAVDVTVRGMGLSLERALEEEVRAFGELAVTEVCKNLMAVFQLTEGAKRRRPAATGRNVDRAAVVGAGVMGAGIAELMAYQAIPVLLVDIDEERVQQGVEIATKLLTKAGKKAEWSPAMLEQRVRCVEGATDYDGFEYVDAVVEAVVESMDIKHQVFGALEKRLSKSALIASNTSALSISQLQADVQHPERVCGLHFFNPPHRMPLVEIVRGEQTSDETLATAFDLALRLRKTPVIVNDSPGFVVNRILAAYLTEAGHLMQEGMRMRALDRVMTEFGMPMGPARLLDEVGLDVIASASKTMESGLGERFRPAPVMVQIFETGVTGKKGGRGFYVYEDGKRRGVNEDIAAILAEAGRGNGPEPHSAEERMVYAMINEAARTLEDGVVAGPEDIDLAMIMGTGFPPFRGGLLRYADRVGLAKIVLRLRELAREHGPQFEPSSALVERQSFF